MTVMVIVRFCQITQRVSTASIDSACDLAAKALVLLSLTDSVLAWDAYCRQASINTEGRQY
jgi:hypothetical protein